MKTFSIVIPIIILFFFIIIIVIQTESFFDLGHTRPFFLKKKIKYRDTYVKSIKTRILPFPM